MTPIEKGPPPRGVRAANPVACRSPRVIAVSSGVGAKFLSSKVALFCSPRGVLALPHGLPSHHSPKQGFCLLRGF